MTKKLILGKVLEDGKIQYLADIQLNETGKAMLLGETTIEKARKAVNRAFNEARIKFKIREIVDNHWSKLDELWSMVIIELEKELK